MSKTFVVTAKARLTVKNSEYDCIPDDVLIDIIQKAYTQDREDDIFIETIKVMSIHRIDKP